MQPFQVYSLICFDESIYLGITIPLRCTTLPSPQKSSLMPLCSHSPHLPSHSSGPKLTWFLELLQNFIEMEALLCLGSFTIKFFVIPPCCVPIVCSFLLWLNSLLFFFIYPFLSFCAYLRFSLLSSLKWPGPSVITCRGIKVTFIFHTDSRNQVTGEMIQLGPTFIPPDKGEKNK